MLRDHACEQERWAQRRRNCRVQARAFGSFIASLPWDWFVTVTVRDQDLSEEPWEPGILRTEGRTAICKPDPRLFRYHPSGRYSPPGGPPAPELVLDRIWQWLADIQRQASGPIGWIVVEEFGRLGGRWHCHLLIIGVSRIHPGFWQAEAFRRFGCTRIEPFDPARGAAYYAGKYAGRSLGEIHFGGTLTGVDVSSCEQSLSRGGGRDVVLSAPLSKKYFHLSLPRRHR
jgi:hypothetical protein